MKFDFQKASEAILPSLTESWRQVATAAGVGLFLGGGAGFIVGGLAAGIGVAGVAAYDAGKGPQ